MEVEMKVLVIVYKFGTAEEIGKELGSYSYFLDQLREIKKQSIELTVLAPWVSWFRRGSTQVRGIPVIRYWPKLATRSLRNLLLYKLINKYYLWRTRKLTEKLAQDFDLIYVRQARETGYAVAKASIDIPKVFQPITTWRWHFEETDDSWFRRIIKDTANQKNYAEEIFNRFDFLVTYNRAMQADYTALGADQDKFTVIPGAVSHRVFVPKENKKELRTRLGISVDKTVFLYVGRINFEEKGIGYLLEALSEVKNDAPDAFLVIIGPGTLVQVNLLKEKIAELHLGDDALYLGKRDYLQLPDYIGAADVGVAPSIWFETQGRTSLDMGSCGIPVIVTDVGGMPEYIIPGTTGFVVPPRDSKVLKEKMLLLTRNKDLRIRMGNKAREHVLEYYTFEKVTERFIEFFKRIK